MKKIILGLVLSAAFCGQAFATNYDTPYEAQRNKNLLTIYNISQKASAQQILKDEIVSNIAFLLSPHFKVKSRKGGVEEMDPRFLIQAIRMTCISDTRSGPFDLIVENHSDFGLMCLAEAVTNVQIKFAAAK